MEVCPFPDMRARTVFVPPFYPGWHGPNELLIFEMALAGGPLTQGYLSLSPSGMGPKKNFERFPKIQSCQVGYPKMLHLVML
jgi:hypothetical protein